MPLRVACAATGAWLECVGFNACAAWKSALDGSGGCDALGACRARAVLLCRGMPGN